MTPRRAIAHRRLELMVSSCIPPPPLGRNTCPSASWPETWSMLVPFFNYLSMALCVVWRSRPTAGEKAAYTLSDDEEEGRARSGSLHTFKSVVDRLPPLTHRGAQYHRSSCWHYCVLIVCVRAVAVVRCFQTGLAASRSPPIGLSCPRRVWISWRSLQPCWALNLLAVVCTKVRHV